MSNSTQIYDVINSMKDNYLQINLNNGITILHDLDDININEILTNPTFDDNIIKHKMILYDDVYTNVIYCYVLDESWNLYMIFVPNTLRIGTLWVHLVNAINKINNTTKQIICFGYLGVDLQNAKVDYSISEISSELRNKVDKFFENKINEYTKKKLITKLVPYTLHERRLRGSGSIIAYNYINKLCESSSISQRVFRYDGTPQISSKFFALNQNFFVPKDSLDEYKNNPNLVLECYYINSKKLLKHKELQLSNSFKYDIVNSAILNLNKLNELAELANSLKLLENMDDKLKSKNYQKLNELYNDLLTKYEIINDSIVNKKYILKYSDVFKVADYKDEKKLLNSVVQNAFDKKISLLESSKPSRVVEKVVESYSNIVSELFETKLYKYNRKNPVYLFENGKLVFKSLPINSTTYEQFKNLIEMKQIGFILNKYVETYKNNSSSDPNEIPYFVYMQNTNDYEFDIIGSFIILPAKGRTKAGMSELYTDENIINFYSRELTEFYVIPSYQFKSNSDNPITFSYYLINEYNKACKNSSNQKGYLIANEIKEVYKYMLYNWKYETSIDKYSLSVYPSHVMYFICNKSVLISEQLAKDLNIDLKKINDDINFIYFNDRDKTNITNYLLDALFLQYELINTKPENQRTNIIVDNKYFELKRKLLTELILSLKSNNIIDQQKLEELNKIKETDRMDYIIKFTIELSIKADELIQEEINKNQYTLLNQLRNVILKSLTIRIDNSNDINKDNIIGNLVFNNTDDAYFFIKIKQFMDNTHDYIHFIVKHDNNNFLIFANKVDGIVKLYSVHTNDQKYNSEQEKICQNLLDILGRKDKTFYDFISDTQIFNSIQYMIKQELRMCQSDEFIKFVQKSETSVPPKMYKKIEELFKFLNTFYGINKQYNYNHDKFPKLLISFNSFLNPDKLLDEIEILCGNDSTGLLKQKIIANFVKDTLLTFFKYSDEIKYFLEFKKMGTLIPYRITDKKMENYLDIFKSSQFGIEIESCFHSEGFDIVKDFNKQGTDIKGVFIGYLNSLPKDILPTNWAEHDNTFFEADKPSDDYSRWRVHIDSSINCRTDSTGEEGTGSYSDPLTSIPMEVVTPILNFDDDDTGINNDWKIFQSNLFEENFGRRNEYMSGLFFLMIYYNFMLNNKVDKLYQPNLKIKTRRNASQGMHLHISNPNIILTMPNRGAYAGLGALKMIYFIRTFAYFEQIMRNFLLRPIDITHKHNTYSQSIYYYREKYASIYIPLNFANKHKEVVSNEIKKVLKDNLSEKKKNDQQIASIFANLRDHVLAKHGAYGGAFSLRMYNMSSGCSTNDLLENSKCKGHIEVRLHHSTDDFAEMYNWTLFINLLLTNCITVIDDLDKAEKGAEFDKLFNELVPDFTDPTGLSLNLFDKLFDDYIQNDTLKRFYRKRCQDLAIKNSNNPSKTLLKLHSPAIFDKDGELLPNSKLIQLMSVYPLDDNLQLPYALPDKFFEILS